MIESKNYRYRMIYLNNSNIENEGYFSKHGHLIISIISKRPIKLRFWSLKISKEKNNIKKNLIVCYKVFKKMIIFNSIFLSIQKFERR